MVCSVTERVTKTPLPVRGMVECVVETRSVFSVGKKDRVRRGCNQSRVGVKSDPYYGITTNIGSTDITSGNYTDLLIPPRVVFL